MLVLPPVYFLNPSTTLLIGIVVANGEEIITVCLFHSLKFICYNLCNCLLCKLCLPSKTIS